jgi:transposase
VNDALQCTAKTAAGERCRKGALPGITLCATHAGARVGRQALLTHEVQRRVVQVLQAGGYPETAAAVAGIGHSTLKKWLKRGAESTAPDDEPYRQLHRAVGQARAESEARNVALIAQAAATNWLAAAWLLERQYPERWARPSQREKPGEPDTAPTDPFAEVDELAQRRRS